MDAKTGIAAKLTIGNFAACSDQMKAYLMLKNLCKYIASPKANNDAMYEYAAANGANMTAGKR